MNPRGTTWFGAIAVRCTRLVLLGTAFRTCMRGLYSAAAIILCLWASLECRTALADEALPRSVLVIDQFELASAGSAAIQSSLRSTLKSNSTSPISIYIENLDLGRFGGLHFRHAVQAYFHEKYQDTPIDIVMPIGSAALELVLSLRRTYGRTHPSSLRRSTRACPSD